VQFISPMSDLAVERSSLLKDLLAESRNSPSNLTLPFPPTISRWHSFVNRDPLSPEALYEIL
jgi:hypothetical protein